ncbi:MAG: serine hydrolase domain-containing protein [Ignavibacteriaceae bacterium]|jgi:CubicO group peptidase (beta-lactamase class C family)
MKILTTPLSRTILFFFLFFGISRPFYGQIKSLNGENINPAGIDNFLKIQMDSLKIPGLSIAVIQDGKIVFSRALGLKNIEKKDSVDFNTLFEAASMTKPVFAYTVIKLSQKHIIDLDTPLYKYYPYEDIDQDDRYKLITARMVLSHTSGFPNWRGGGGSELTINFDPGTKYSYSGEGYEYLGLVIKHLTGKKLQDIIRDEVFAPLNIQNAYFIENDYLKEHMATGHTDNKVGNRGIMMREHMAYGLHIEAKEYAKFIIALKHESDLQEGIFKTMSLPQIEVEPKKTMGLGIFIEDTPFGIKYSHGGNNGNQFNSNFEFYKDHGIGYVYFMNCNKGPQFTKKFDEFLANAK